MKPKIAIGCPVRNRAWVLPEYLWTLCGIDYDNKHYIFLENDSEDNTLEILQDKKWFMPEHVTVESITTSADHWQRGAYAHNQYENLANVRNQFLEMFLRTDADYLLSVDSDVIVPPDIVTRLLEHAARKPFRWNGDVHEEIGAGVIVGAAISNIPNKPLDGQTPGNWMNSKDGGKTYYHPPYYGHHGLREVDLIGAVYLIPRQAIEDGARYAPHGQGEDAPFCQQAQALGYRLLVNMDVRCEHRMVKPE